MPSRKVPRTSSSLIPSKIFFARRFSFSAYDAGSGTLSYRVAKSKWKSFSVRVLPKLRRHRRIAELGRRAARSGEGPRAGLAVGRERFESCGRKIRTRVRAFRYQEGSSRTNSPPKTANYLW